MEIRVLLERRDAIQAPFRCKTNRRTVGSHLLAHFLTSRKVMAIRQLTLNQALTDNFFHFCEKNFDQSRNLE